MEDFDFVGMGGFLIECGQDGEVLGITKEQAVFVEKNCEFFKGCFRHGTVERNGIIRKPDWSLAIARHLIQVLVQGRTTVPTLELYQQLLEAGDQALVDLRLCSMVNYMDPMPTNNHRFLELVQPARYKFQFRANISSHQWIQLLAEQDILLYRAETNFVVQAHRDQVLSKGQTQAQRKLDTRISDYLVHADRAVYAIMQLQKILQTKRIPEAQDASDEGFSIYFETTVAIPKDHHELIDRLAGGEAYIRTCADASEIKTEGYTVRASLDVLQRAIRPLKDTQEVILCSLRIDHPTPDTLGRFVNACQRAKDYPNTVGIMDGSSNRYFAKKTIQDVWTILEYMADFSTACRIQGDFHLYQRSSEDEPF